MDVYVGNDLIKQIFVGGEGYIKEAYYGRSLVYQIASLFEKAVAGTYSFYAPTDGVYRISACGGGGGAAGGTYGDGNTSTGGSGGSAAAFDADIVLNAGNYTIVVGAAGTRGASGRATGPNGGAGGTTTITRDSDSNTFITCGGGSGGKGRNNGGPTGGAGGTLSQTATIVTSYILSNGSKGSTSGWFENNYGAGGAGVYKESGKAGHVGYVCIKYISQSPMLYTFTINPTPSDATVQLTVDGTTYNQSSISVVSGKTVSWSVSKTGYTTQTGSNTVTEDTTENVVLEENPILYYCYRNFSGNVYHYMYLLQKPTGPSTITAYYKSSSSDAQVSSSSQLTYTLNWTVTSATDSSFVITASGSSATWDYYQSGDLYT